MLFSTQTTRKDKNTTYLSKQKPVTVCWISLPLQLEMEKLDSKLPELIRVYLVNKSLFLEALHFRFILESGYIQ